MTEPETPMTKQMILDEYKQAYQKSYKGIDKETDSYIFDKNYLELAEICAEVATYHFGVTEHELTLIRKSVLAAMQ